ncbi:MAG: hypothetical protein HZA70_00460 [Planctomycetes bacterium]|nr:hypothetical protein [Planctomycetota bacterium]
MKKSHTILVAFLSLALFTGQSSEDVMRNFNNFEKSLTDWMRSMEKLRERLGEVEKSTQGGGQVMDRLSELSKNLNAVRTELADMTTRLNKMDTTLGSGENPMVQFAKTMEVLKKSIAELGKKTEDQSITIAVLEKRYQEYMRPLDPLKKSIAEGEEAIKKLNVELELQKKNAEILQKSILEKLAALDTLMTATAGQQESSSKLLTRIESLEKYTGAPPPQEALPKEVAAAAAEELARPKTPEEEGYETIGGGFYIRNVQFSSFGSSARIVGELKNLSETDQGMATFAIRIFDLENNPVVGQDFTIKGFKNKDVKPFKEIIPGIEPEKISKYTVKFKGTY